MLTQVKLLLGITDTSKDALLNYLIDTCSEEAADFCNLPEFDDRLERIVVQMVIVRYNRIGTEGVSGQSFSGVNESFVEGYPLDIMNSLRRYRKIVLV